MVGFFYVQLADYIHNIYIHYYTGQKWWYFGEKVVPIEEMEVLQCVAWFCHRKWWPHFCTTPHDARMLKNAVTQEPIVQEWEWAKHMPHSGLSEWDITSTWNSSSV